MSENITQQTYKVSAKIDAMKTTLSAIKEYVDYATFKLESDGLTIYAMDPSHISLLDIFLERGTSINYDHEFSFAVDPEEFLKELKKFKIAKNSYDVLNMEIFGGEYHTDNSDESDHYMILNYKEQIGKVMLKEVMTSSIAKPKFVLTSKLVLIEEVVKAITAFEQFGPTITLKTNKEDLSFKVKVQGVSIKNLEAELFSAGESEIIEDTSAGYMLKYLNPILKVYIKSTENSSRDLTLEFGNKCR